MQRSDDQQRAGRNRSQQRSTNRIYVLIFLLLGSLLFSLPACKNSQKHTIVRPVSHHRYYKRGKDRRTRRTKTVKLKQLHGKAPKPPKKKEPKVKKADLNQVSDFEEEGSMEEQFTPTETDSIPQ